MGMRDCGCRHTTGTGMGIRAGVDVNFFMRCTVYRGFHVLIYRYLYACAQGNLPLRSSPFWNIYLCNLSGYLDSTVASPTFVTVATALSLSQQLQSRFYHRHYL